MRLPIVGYSNWFGVFARCAVGVVLLFAAVMKAHEPHGLGEVWAWMSVGRPYHGACTIGLIVIESMIGTAVLLRWSKLVRLASIVLIIIFTITLIVMLASDSAPDCHCLGLIRAFESRRTGLLSGIGRNMILLALLFSAPLDSQVGFGSFWSAVVKPDRDAVPTL